MLNAEAKASAAMVLFDMIWLRRFKTRDEKNATNAAV